MLQAAPTIVSLCCAVCAVGAMSAVKRDDHQLAAKFAAGGLACMLMSGGTKRDAPQARTLAAHRSAQLRRTQALPRAIGACASVSE